MQFSNRNYYGAMDDLDDHKYFQTLEDAPKDMEGNIVTPEDSLNFTAKDIGTTTNPMANQLESLKARIREGAARIEFEFIGQGKGNSQQPTPESFGTEERRDIRELLKINEMKTSTHAALHNNSLAGFSGQNGFSVEARAAALKEIKKAIDFASEATKGGAIVFHLNEWQRPMSLIEDKSKHNAKFMAYENEDKDATLFAVDARTGKIADVVNKDVELYRPVYLKAKDKGLAGKKDVNGNLLHEDDWVDMGGKLIKKNDSPERLFDRVPIFDETKTNFRTESLKWNDLIRETEEFNKNNKGDKLSPEEMWARIRLENRILQAKGSSLYHARYYKREREELDDMKEKFELLQNLDKRLPENEKWKLRGRFNELFGGRVPHDVEPLEYMRQRIREQEDTLRHTHEQSSSMDVQARESEEMLKNLKSAEKYGLDKTADTIANAALYAHQMFKSREKKFGLEDPIYVAPENWDPRQFGSHPDEYMKIIRASRDKFSNMMQKKGHSKEESEKLAKQHIRGTLDIGHMNMWRQHFQGKNEEDFDKWMLDMAEKLVKEGYVGHIHLTDNFGFDDEHLTPGQGNVPMKEFLKRIEAAGIKDIIVEQGSYNPLASIETLNLVNSPIYGVGRRQRFGSVRNAHFGYNAPGFFIAGTYSPSNDWRPWTEIPLE